MFEWIDKEMKETMKIPFFWLILGMFIWLDYQIASDWINEGDGREFIDEKLHQLVRWKEYLIGLFLR